MRVIGQAREALEGVHDTRGGGGRLLRSVFGGNMHKKQMSNSIFMRTRQKQECATSV